MATPPAVLVTVVKETERERERLQNLRKTGDRRWKENFERDLHLSKWLPLGHTYENMSSRTQRKEETSTAERWWWPGAKDDQLAV
jgi:hypothetical protein